ncbi:MAG: DUF433 domain-containing protein [bacterium]
MAMAAEIAPGITIASGIRFGKPVVKGTRVPVHLVVGSFASGMAATEVAEEYGLTLDDIRACLSYAACLVEEQEIRALA